VTYLGHCPECEVITYNGKLCRYHEGMRVLNELEAALATVTCERDDLLYTLNKERWEANDAARVAGTEWHKALDRCRELESERDEAVHLLRTAQVEREKVADEHEALVDALTRERDGARAVAQEVVTVGGWGATQDCDCEQCERIEAALQANPWLKDTREASSDEL
jgi:hypothetical protein